MTDAAPLLTVRDLQVHFPIKSGLLRRRTGTIRAVDGVSFDLSEGETLGLVGESGCGKTTTGRAVLGLATATGGTVTFEGRDITHLGRGARKSIRLKMQYVFQDPYSSLNPIKTVGDIIAEPLRIHGIYEAEGGSGRVDELLELVGLSSRLRNRFPSEFSGGQRQRIGIARALALNPKLLILDEPVAALDVSIQAQIVNLLMDLQDQLGMAYLFIAHDLSVVRHISDRMLVMYLGRLVEEGAKRDVYRHAAHPYTHSLLSAVPIPDPARRSSGTRIVLEGDIPSPSSPPAGCHFHPRCFRAEERCRTEVPLLEARAGLPTRSACHFPGPFEAAELVRPKEDTP